MYGEQTIITRSEARELGLKKYFTGKPCVKGHLTERYTKSTNCVGCLARTTEQGSYHNMIQRCENPNSDSWRWYGGRGIKVCEGWRRSEATFLRDMGPKPHPKMTLGRIDNDKGYSPQNCIWTTQREQHRNKRNTIKIEIDGRQIILKDACDDLGISYNVLYRLAKRLLGNYQAAVDYVRRDRPRRRPPCRVWGTAMLNGKPASVQAAADFFGITHRAVTAMANNRFKGSLQDTIDHYLTHGAGRRGKRLK